MRIRVDGVSKTFGRTTALDDVSFDVERGVIGLLGPNGAGKTSLLRILATVALPDIGRVCIDRWDAADPAERVEIRRRLGYLPQELGLYQGFTVFQFVDYVAALKQMRKRSERAAAVEGALDAVDMLGASRKRIRTLSGGMRRRVGIAQALVGHPELLLLDEPTTGLDPEQRAQFRRLIASLGEERTVILSTHLVEDIAAVCRQVVVLIGGKVAFEGAPAELRGLATGKVWSSPRHVETAAMSWRTEDGRYRVLSAESPPDATTVDPTLEDGYLLLSSGTRPGRR